MAALALAGSFAPSLMRRGRREQVAISLGSAALGAAAGWATESLVVQLARRLEGGETAARLTVAGAGAAAALLRLDRTGPALALAGTGARVAGMAALLGWAAPERRRVAGFDWLPLAAAGALGVAGVALRADARRRGRPPLPYPAERYLPSVSHGPDSLVRGLDFEGERFVAGAMPALRRDPVRVFVGLRSAPTVAARCDLAVAELERLGAFERSRLVVCAATLRGYVNPVPLAAEELLCDGDVAHVAVQYFDRRTALLWRKVPIAAQTHRELLARLTARTGPDGPELVVYGESLGAWASQQVVRDDGPDGLERRGVARALWVGTPHLSRFGRRARLGVAEAAEAPRRSGRPKSRLRRAPVRYLCHDARVAVLRTGEVLAWAAGEAADPVPAAARYVLFERLTDPVVLFPGLELLWRRPPWAPGGSWWPGVSFLQGLLDLVKATRWTTEQPSAEGHDYRLELPLAVDLALGHGRSREAALDIARTVLETEAARAAAVRSARQAARASAPRGPRGRRARRPRLSRSSRSASA